MKKRIYGLCFLFVIVLSGLQAGPVGSEDYTGSFAGKWSGEITLLGSSTVVPVTLDLVWLPAEGRYALGPSSLIAPTESAPIDLGQRKSAFTESGDNLVVTIVAKSDIWSDAQVFACSRIDDRLIELVWARHVVNIAGSKKDTWFAVGNCILRLATDPP